MGSKRGRNRQLTKRRIKEVLEGYDHSFMTTSELVDQVPVSRPVVVDRLEELVEQGEVETRKTSNMRIWWLAGRVATSPNERVIGDELILDLDDRLRERLEEIAAENDVTPERAALEIVAGELEDPAVPYWESTKTIGFAFSLIFVGYSILFLLVDGIILNVATAVTAIAMGVFFMSFLLSILTPVVEPAVVKAQDWWEERRN